MKEITTMKEIYQAVYDYSLRGTVPTVLAIGRRQAKIIREYMGLPPLAKIKEITICSFKLEVFFLSYHNDTLVLYGLNGVKKPNP